MMARVDINPEKSREDALRETVRKEVRGEMRASVRRRKGLGCLGCLLFFVIIVVLMAGGALWFFSRTGLVTVPVFSRFYTPPAPTRIVETGKSESFDQMFQKQFEAAARVAVRSGKLPETITIAVSEENLTVLLGETVAGLAAEHGIQIQQLQAAVLPGEVELFGDVLLARGARVLVRARLVFEIKDGVPTVRVNSATLGAIPIHPAPLNALVNQYLNIQLVSASAVLTREIGAITAIIAEDGTLLVTFAPKTKN